MLAVILHPQMQKLVILVKQILAHYSSYYHQNIFFEVHLKQLIKPTISQQEGGTVNGCSLSMTIV